MKKFFEYITMFRKSITEHGYELTEVDKRIKGERYYYYINHNNKNRIAIVANIVDRKVTIYKNAKVIDKRA